MMLTNQFESRILLSNISSDQVGGAMDKQLLQTVTKVPKKLRDKS